MHNISAVIYTSQANENFSLKDIREMLLRAKVFNRQNNISGCLLYHNKRFLQLFEGEAGDVKALNDQIQSDVRHYNIETQFQGNTGNRLWKEWAMAFYEISGSSENLSIKKEMLENQISSAVSTVHNSKAFQIFIREAKALLD
ncbi:MAG: BLUF domain-containing protein [Flavobacteriaceae bacterium]|nr:BLUF domain-containing protein [Flavobacteriaceae bacterium]